jgi:hypothetical protein
LEGVFKLSTNVINLNQYKLRRRIEHVKQIILSPDVMFFSIVTSVIVLLAIGCFELSTTDAVKSYYQMYGNQQLAGYFYSGT